MKFLVVLIVICAAVGVWDATYNNGKVATSMKRLGAEIYTYIVLKGR